ncbi:hypothetical protein OIE62_11595 [Streptomyces scopuliridis]|uniref:Uncharacterized protein n=1 Tax=Streptomyces scopuliridis TaxID=452529 RepID=A0ACD4ZSM2_9ACTN|nr:hypothetical protein [Streptomyces scopuliridis]WSC00792.1 hypothetical protein OG835_29800 [Streptomyces scopuliridis]WSC05597.1 hypothetical protein OIE62_11595 [Streptomyces scopuliridis]
MDAGLAAVLGALAGSMATISAAIAATRSQRETARLNTRAEHRRQRREPRHDIYKGFISNASELQDQLEIFKDFELYPDSVTDETVQRCRNTVKALRDKWVEVGLVGPGNVAAAGKGIEQLARKVALQAERLKWFLDNDDERRKLAEQAAIAGSFGQLAELLDSFITLAQGALDDDGSLK